MEKLENEHIHCTHNIKLELVIEFCKTLDGGEDVFTVIENEGDANYAAHGADEHVAIVYREAFVQII